MTADHVATEPPPPALDLGRSFTYIVEDPRWVPKLSLAALFGAAAVLLTLLPAGLFFVAWLPPDALAIFIELYPPLADVPTVTFTPRFYVLVLPFTGGLLIGALLLGYYIELVRRTRRDEPQPLPAWANVGPMFTDGLLMMAAYAGYIASNIALLLVGVAAFRATGSDIALLVGVYCCVLPLMGLWGLAIIFLTSINVVPFSESRDIRAFFNIPWVLRRLREDRDPTGRWFLYGVLANFGIGAVQSVPVIGVLVSLAFSIPIQGHLLGQYARVLDERHGRV